MQKLYRLRTTFLGADSATELYFDTLEKAQKELESCVNGEIDLVTFEADYKLNYCDGCTYNDLTYGNFDAVIVNVE